MPHVTADDGTALYYECDSPDAGEPTLVFLNGMTQSTEHWGTQVENVRDDAGVLVYDARGQGRSEVGDRDVSMSLHLSDLTTLLDHLDLGPVHLVGFSHGARVALGFAARHRSRAESLLLCSLTVESNARARTIVRSWKHVLDAGGLEAMTWAALPDILGNDYLETHEPILDGIVEASLRRNDEAGVRALIDGLEGYPDNEALARDVEVPTLVLSGDEDPLVDEPGARRLAELAGGEHQSIEGTGHTIPIERPERFHSIVADFVGL
jgi:3-oxoadipate enol-lactonase